MTAEEIFKYYKQLDKKFGLPHKDKWKTFAQPKVQKNKLKIGYVSPDFKKHSVQSFYYQPSPITTMTNSKFLLLQNLIRLT